MEKLTLLEIEKAVCGKLNIKSSEVENIEIFEISTDSRAKSNKGLFIPIVGENFDGHDYIEKAIDCGNICVLSQMDLAIEIPYILVCDTKKALRDLAKYFLAKIRSKTNIPVVAITGSSGKTSTKDLIASVLEAKYNVLKTQGNFNNEIGLPLTIFNLTYEHSALVLEMGMNHFGEIHNLSEIAKPDIAVITNIGISHAEFLGGREGIFKAKTEIFDFMEKDGKIVLWGEDDFLKNLRNNEKFLSKFDKNNIYYYGTSKDNDLVVKNISYKENLSGMLFTVNEQEYEINLCGTHMVLNSVCAIGIARLLEISFADIQKALLTAELSKMRLTIEKNKKMSITVINDAYNANPNSVMSAIDVLSNAKGRKIAILGDMLELGEYTKKGHFETGEYAYELGIDFLIAIGEHSKNIYDGFNLLNKDNKREMLYFQNALECTHVLESFLQKEDTVLVKASRGMKLEEVANYIKTL